MFIVGVYKLSIIILVPKLFDFQKFISLKLLNIFVLFDLLLVILVKILLQIYKLILYFIFPLNLIPLLEIVVDLVLMGFLGILLSLLDLLGLLFIKSISMFMIILMFWQMSLLQPIIDIFPDLLDSLEKPMFYNLI